MPFEFEVSRRRSFAVHHPKSNFGPREMRKNLGVRPRKPVNPMIEAADFTVEVAIKRCGTSGDVFDTTACIVEVSRVQLTWESELQVRSGDFDSHRSREYKHKVTKLQIERVSRLFRVEYGGTHTAKVHKISTMNITFGSRFAGHFFRIY